MQRRSQSETKEMRMQEALREALRSEMARDPRVFVMGEDVALFGGAYGVTRGLIQEFGDKRVLDTPISESALVGLAVGAAINGMRPVVEIQFADLLPLAMDQLASHAARYHYMTGGPSECADGDPHQVRHPCRRRTEPLELQPWRVHSFSRIEDRHADDASRRQRDAAIGDSRSQPGAVLRESSSLWRARSGAGRRLHRADRQGGGAPRRKRSDDRHLRRYGFKSRRCCRCS